LAYFTYHGPLTDSYLLNYRGICYPQMRCVEGLCFESNWKARGILVQGMRYGATFRRMSANHSRQVGIDSTDCWGSTWTEIGAEGCRGIAVRAWDWNNVTANGWKLSQYSIDHKDYKKRSEMEKLIMSDGIQAARDKYGSDLIEEWPDVNDSSVIDLQGRPLRTTECNRAAVVFSSGNSAMRQWCIEGAHSYQYPVVNIANTKTSILSCFRFEGTATLVCLIRGEDCWANRIECMQMSLSNPAPYAVVLHGKARRNVISNARGAGLTEAILHLTTDVGKQQWGNRVEDSYVIPAFGNWDEDNVASLIDDAGQIY